LLQCCLSDSSEVRIEPFIGRFDRSAKEPLLTLAQLVAGCEQYRTAPRVKGKSGTPYSTVSVESQFNIEVRRSVERIDVGAA
jgi:hypothetical protein